MPGNASSRPSPADKPTGRHRPKHGTIQLAELIEAYGWAAIFIDELCRRNTSLADFVLKAPAHTRHYIALAIVGSDRDNEDWPEKLAAVLASRQRRTVLTEAFGQDLGSLRALTRLGDEVFAPGTYQALATVLASPSRRKAHGDVVRLNERAINRIAEAPENVIAAYRGRLVASFGASGIAFLVNGIRRIRPDLTGPDVDSRLNALERPWRIERLMERLTRDLTVPAPPWEGTATIKPLTTVKAMRAAGLRLENCLNTFSMWNQALTGQRAFYIAEDTELVAVSLARHDLFGTWFVHSLAKRRNGKPRADVKTRIVAAFAEAGFPFLDDTPIGDAW